MNLKKYYASTKPEIQLHYKHSESRQKDRRKIIKKNKHKH